MTWRGERTGTDRHKEKTKSFVIVSGYPHTDEDRYPFLTRYTLWNFWSSPLSCKLQNSVCSNPCRGKYVRMVCIFSIRDLPGMTSQPHLFANKFHWDYEPLARQCLEEWHYNRTRQPRLFNTNLNMSYYRNLSFVKDKVAWTEIQRNASESGLKCSGTEVGGLVLYCL